MNFLGWFFKIILAVMGVSLFLLQSQSVKKMTIEYFFNKPLADTPISIEVGQVRGLFPFKFIISSLEIKRNREHLTTLADLTVIWTVPALLAKEVQLDLIKGHELTGYIIYYFGKDALRFKAKGRGYALSKEFMNSNDIFGGKIPGESEGSLTSIVIDLPSLQPLRGVIKAKICHGQEEFSHLSMSIIERSAERIDIEDLRLDGIGIKGKGKIKIYPKIGDWEGSAGLGIDDMMNFLKVQTQIQNLIGGSFHLNFMKAANKLPEIKVMGTNISYEDYRAKNLQAQVQWFPKQGMSIQLQGKELVVNMIPLSRINGGLTLKNGKGIFDLSGHGSEATKATVLTTHGSFAQLPETVDNKGIRSLPQTEITLSRVEFIHPKHQFLLAKPAKILWKDNDIQISNLVIKSGQGVINAQNLAFNDWVRGDITVDRMPLTILRIVNPDWIASGTLSGKGKLGGTLTKPDLSLLIQGKSLQWGVAEKHLSRGHIHAHRFAGIDLSSNLSLLKGEFLTWKLKATGGKYLNLTSDGKLTLDHNRVAQTSSIESDIKGHVDMGVISLFIPFGDLIHGKANIDLMMKGTVKTPILSGHINLINGLYENATYGTVIKNIRIQGTAFAHGISLTSITGQDSAKGNLTGTCHLKFTNLLDPEVDLKLKLNQMMVIQNDEISGKASGDLRLYGPLSDAKITGDALIQPIEVRLEEHEKKLASIILLEQKMDHSYQTVQERKGEVAREKGPEILPINIKLRAPGQIFLRGFGFNAQWKGDLKAIGPITDAQLVGQLTLVRGTFDMIGKPLKLLEGQITYSKEVINDPLFSIVGTRDVGEITVTMRIEGRASNPKITFSSQPALPQEEILARLLFGKGLEGISVTQSLQLANALNAFKGNKSLNFTDKIRSAFGLDSLEFKERKPLEEDEFTSPGQMISVGKQISEKLYLSLDQAISGDEPGTNATVQYDLTPTLKIKADVGGTSNAGLGFDWVKKY